MSAAIHLSIREPDGSLTRHTALPGEYFFGRDPRCEFVLQSPEVSRRHVRMKFDGSAFELEDLGSTSGTTVQGHPLTRVLRLRYPQLVEVGNVAVNVTKDATEPQPEPPREHLPVAEKEDRKIGVTVAADAAQRGDILMPGLAEEVTQKLKLLCDLPLQFAAEPDLNKLCSLILIRAMQITSGAKRGVLLITEPATGRLAVCACVPEDHPPVSRTLVQRAAREQQGFIWSGEKDDAGIYVPMVWQGETAGLIFAGDPDRRDAFSRDDLQFLIQAARYAACALAARA